MITDKHFALLRVRKEVLCWRQFERELTEKLNVDQVLHQARSLSDGWNARTSEGILQMSDIFQDRRKK